MAETTKIEWADATWNPWIGCTKVSPACDSCYAAALAKRTGGPIYAAGEPRRLTSDGNWRKPLAWNRKAAAKGQRYSVFPSLCDPFDTEVSDEWRDAFFCRIGETPNLDWLLLSKRHNVQRVWLNGGRAHRAYNLGRLNIREAPIPISKPLPNVWAGVSVENQAMAAARLPALAGTDAVVRFISAEPILEELDLRPWLKWIDWVIAGGESGPKARPMHPDWARTLRDQCQAAGVAFFFKQWGEWSFVYDRDKDDPDWRRCPESDGDKSRYVNLVGGHGFHGERVCFAHRVGKKRAGRLLDGREWNELPEVRP